LIALTSTAGRQRLQDGVVDETRVSVTTEDGRNAKAGTIGGDEGGGDGTALVAACAGVDVEGDGVDALLDGSGVDANSGDEEGGE
jgi:hypothetical protein